ncbi:MAG: tetratricopeptide repeat protein [Candidatus Latescibacteria bacterium]|nr:tetratricopeptide repeat protein [Candidatus Latescibacterota bacterium]
MSVSSGKLEKICVKNPTSVLFARLADEVLSAGDVKRAVEICRRGLRYRPSYATGHLVMGRCHLASGRSEEARQEFHKVLQLDSDNLTALWLIGKIEIQMGWPESALQRFERILLLDPLNPEVAAQAQALRGSNVSAPVRADDEDPASAGGPLDSDDGPGEEPTRVAGSLGPNVSPPSAVDKIEAANATPTTVEDLGLLVREIVSGARTSEGNRDEDRTTRVDPPTIATVTLAELYATQGLVDRAADVLEEVVNSDPENARAAQRLSALRGDRENAGQESL